MSNAFEVGTQLVALCKEGKFHEAISSLYSPDIVSVEAMEGEHQTVSGLDAVLGKAAWWGENHEVHSAEVTGPFPNGDKFVVFFNMDVTFKPEGRRFNMQEAALYKVADGKIVKEKFFYPTGG